MKRIGLLLIIMATSMAAWAQSYSDQFYDALNRDDLVQQRAILADWEMASPDDVDLYIARYNYFINASAIPSPTSSDPTLTTSLTTFNPTIADSGLVVIEEAIRNYSKRLDLRFGKIFFLGELQRWQAFTDEIVRMLNRSELMNHEWVFPNIEEGFEDLILESIQDYLATMSQHLSHEKDLTAADMEIILCMRQVSQRTVQVFPSDIQSVLSLGTTYLMLKDYEPALKYFLRAEKIDPTDPRALANLATVYSAQGNKKKAQEYKKRLTQVN